MFWIGLLGFILSVVNMIAVRFLIVVFLVLLLIDYAKTKNIKEVIEPSLYVDEQQMSDEPLVRVNPFFHQMLYKDQATENRAYEWKDVNVHGGIGDRMIDLSNTVLPEDTAVISIRHFIGNIVIYIPYETEFMIHHSAIFGRAYILHERHYNLMNQNIAYRTKKYYSTTQRVKIVTSLLSGNIEVKRI